MKSIIFSIAVSVSKFSIKFFKAVDSQDRFSFFFHYLLSRWLMPYIEYAAQLQIPKLKKSITFPADLKVDVFQSISSQKNHSGIAVGSNSIEQLLINKALLGQQVRASSYLSIPAKLETKLDPRANSFFNLFLVNAKQMIFMRHLLDAKNFELHYNVGYWYWELEKFPYKRWEGVFRCLDEVWTSSEFSRSSIAASAPIQVFTIPPAISTETQQTGCQYRDEFGLRHSPFIFLFVFDFLSYCERKNPIALIQSFKRAFGLDDKVLLLIKCTNSKRYPAQNKAMMKEVNQPNIQVISKSFSYDQSKRLFNACDAYVSLHRSEGFGLTLAEAMALGKPVITTGYSGNMDFTNESNSYLVKYKLVPILKTVGPYEKGSVWAEPDIDHAAELMVQVRENYQQALRKAEIARREIREKYNAERIGGMVKERLTKIYENALRDSK